MLDRIIDWLTVEPVVGSLMVVAAVVLFGSAILKVKDPSPTFWQWVRTIIESSIGAILFLGLLWAFRSILNDNNLNFYATHGSLTDVSLRSAQSIWGRPHAQRDLGYAHYTDVIVQEEVPRENLEDPPQYIEKVERQHVPQNSIVSFRGDVQLSVSQREKGYALYNGYVVEAHFQYEVINNSSFVTEAVFDFALTSGQTIYDNFSITVDGEDISDDLRFNNNLVQWRTDFEPQQIHRIDISYTSRGMESFYYQIPSQREIKDFELVVTVDQLPFDLIDYPDGVLTPMQVEKTDDGEGVIMTWTLDKAITTAGMGVKLPQPDQPGAQVLRVLNNSPYALTLLGAMVALTLMLRGEPVNFIVLALMAGAYSLQFLIMASISDYSSGFWGAMLVGAGLTGVLTYLLFRHFQSRLLRYLIYGLVVFFTIIYPLSGLLDDAVQRNSFEALVQAGLIVYLFVLALYTRLEQTGEAESRSE